MARKCSACGKRSAVTEPDWPALCQACLDRTGEPINVGDRVVSRVDELCNGTALGSENDGLTIVVSAENGLELQLPIQDLVKRISRQ